MIQIFISTLYEDILMDLTWFFRAAGPFSPRLLQRIRPDLMRKYEGLIEENNLNIISQEYYSFNSSLVRVSLSYIISELFLYVFMQNIFFLRGKRTKKNLLFWYLEFRLKVEDFSIAFQSWNLPFISCMARYTVFLKHFPTLFLAIFFTLGFFLSYFSF